MDVSYFSIEQAAGKSYGFLVFGEIPPEIVQAFGQLLGLLPKPISPAHAVESLKALQQALLQEGLTCGEVDYATEEEWEMRIDQLPAPIH